MSAMIDCAEFSKENNGLLSMKIGFVIEIVILIQKKVKP